MYVVDVALSTMELIRSTAQAEYTHGVYRVV